MKLKIIPFFLLFTTSVNANQPTAEQPRQVAQVAYVATDSICLDGLVASLSGHSCKNIHFGERANFKYTVECTDVTEEDHVTKGAYVVIEHALQSKFDLTGFDTMCIDSNLLILREANIK